MKHWRILSYLILPFLLSISGWPAGAANLAFDNLTDAQAKKIIEEFSANFTHTSVSGASPLGDIFGFDVGVVGGLTTTPEIDKLAKSADPTVDAGKLPHAGILAMVSVPFGVTLEGLFIPAVGSADFKFKTLGLGAKWTLTNLFLDWPFSLALKAHVMKTNLNFRQTVSAVTSEITFDDTVTGVMILASKKLVLVEPYIGIGAVSGSGEFGVSGTASFFSSGVQSYSAKATGSQLVAGVEANLLILKLGAEYSQQFGTSRFSLKAGFTF